MRKTLVLPNNITLTSNGIMVIMIKPLAPLKTSIEFIVLPTISTIERISRMYSSGMNALSNIKPR